MHAPDGFFSLGTNVALGAVSAGAIAYAAYRVKRDLPEKVVPLMGVTAAFVFAAQMINFPIAAGTSGHLLGGVLAAVLVGPWAGTLVMASVIVVQCVLFQDGGLTVLGPNIFNMGLVGTLGGYAVYRAFAGRRGAARIIGGSFFAAWVSVTAAALFCSLELAASGTVTFTRAFPAMTGVHMLIGIGEGLITALVVAFVVASRRDLVYRPQRGEARGLRTAEVLVGVAVALVVAGVLAPFASADPDGLEKVAESRGFVEKAAESPVPGVLPDYSVPWINSAVATTALAGVIGTVVLFGVAFLVGQLLKARQGGAAM